MHFYSSAGTASFAVPAFSAWRRFAVSAIQNRRSVSYLISHNSNGYKAFYRKNTQYVAASNAD